MKINKSSIIGMVATIAITLVDTSTTLAKTTEVTVQPAGTAAPTTIVVTRPSSGNFYVCYHLHSKYVNHNIAIQRCNPYGGVCREIIIPRKLKVMTYDSCQIQTKSCSGYTASKYGWYSSNAAAMTALGNCREHPVVIETQK